MTGALYCEDPTQMSLLLLRHRCVGTTGFCCDGVRMGVPHLFRFDWFNGFDDYLIEWSTTIVFFGQSGSILLAWLLGFSIFRDLQEANNSKGYDYEGITLKGNTRVYNIHATD